MGNFMKQIIAVTALIAASVNGAVLNGSQMFAGKYSDPNHPNCPRTIESVSAHKALVSGSDPAPGHSSCNGRNDEAWGPLDAQINGDEIVVDFSPKGGPSDLTGHYDSSSSPQ